MAHNRHPLAIYRVGERKPPVPEQGLRQGGNGRQLARCLCGASEGWGWGSAGRGAGSVPGLSCGVSPRRHRAARCVLLLLRAGRSARGRCRLVVARQRGSAPSEEVLGHELAAQVVRLRQQQLAQWVLSLRGLIVMLSLRDARCAARGAHSPPSKESQDSAPGYGPLCGRTCFALRDATAVTRSARSGQFKPSSASRSALVIERMV